MDLDLSFEVITETHATPDSGRYSDGCSGSRSDCCTRVCTRINDESSTLEAWDLYLDINTGVLQY